MTSLDEYVEELKNSGITHYDTICLTMSSALIVVASHIIYKLEGGIGSLLVAIGAISIILLITYNCTYHNGDVYADRFNISLVVWYSFCMLILICTIFSESTQNVGHIVWKKE